VIRRRFLALLLAARAARAHTPVADREFLQRVVDMERAWDIFYRRLAGCPKKGPADAAHVPAGAREAGLRRLCALPPCRRASFWIARIDGKTLIIKDSCGRT